MLTNVTIDLDFGILGELPVTFLVSAYPLRKGNRSGHPDSWTPDEEEEIEVINVYCAALTQATCTQIVAKRLDQDIYSKIAAALKEKK